MSKSLSSAGRSLFGRFAAVLAVVAAKSAQTRTGMSSRRPPVRRSRCGMTLDEVPARDRRLFERVGSLVLEP